MARQRVMTPLRWSDMDAYGHVNNVQFLRLIEEARVVALSAAGSDDGGTVLSTGILVARSQIEYLHPLVYRPTPVAIDMWVSRIAGASFDLSYEVVDETPPPVHAASGRGHQPVTAPDDGSPIIYARAETTMVVFDLAAGRPRKITPEERERLHDWSDAPLVWRHR